MYRVVIKHVEGNKKVQFKNGPKKDVQSYILRLEKATAVLPPVEAALSIATNTRTNDKNSSNATLLEAVTINSVDRVDECVENLIAAEDQMKEEEEEDISMNRLENEIEGNPMQEEEYINIGNINRPADKGTTSNTYIF